MYAFWPTPTGLGAALMKANVGMFHAGVCALAFGTSRVEAPIEIVKNIAIAIAVVLFLVKFMYFSSFFSVSACYVEECLFVCKKCFF
jgi:hypothetical protein